MTKKLPYKFLFFTCILLQFTFGDSVAQARNVENLYLKSSSESVKIKPNKLVGLVVQNEINSSTFNVIEKRGKIISLSDSLIVLSKVNQEETLVVNNKRKQRSYIHYFNETPQETLDLKEVIAVLYYPKGTGFFGHYYSINDSIQDKYNCECTPEQLKDIKRGFQLVKLE
jgi:hypothetical protein